MNGHDVPSAQVRRRPQDTIRCDRQCPVADAGGVPHRVGNGRGGTDDPDLSCPLDTRGVVQVLVVDPADLDGRDVRVRGDVVAREVSIEPLPT